MMQVTEECERCEKDWCKCGTCPINMQWVKEQRERNRKQKES